MMNGGALTVRRVQKTNYNECEALILTLASLSEIVAWNGIGVLERIHLGRFDEADLHCEEIPEIHRKKVNLDLIRNDFFGDLIFAFQLTGDYEYACQLMETHIVNEECSDEVYRDMVLQYVGVRMLCKKRLPWEIEYSLCSIAQRGISLLKSVQDYMNGTETYADCVNRYRSHWKNE